MKDKGIQADRFKHPDAMPPSPNIGGTEASPEVHKIQGLPRSPRPPRRRVVRKLFGWLLVVIVLAALIYIIYLGNIVAKVSTNPWQLGPLAADPSGRTNVLVLGVGDPGHAGEALSDTIMMVSLDNKSKRVAQVSVPRDLRVTLPGYGLSKINAANAYGGVSLAEQAVSNTLGVPLDYYLKTDFSGMKNIVDAVGGIDVNVKSRLLDKEYPCTDNQYKACGLDIMPGLQHMNGSQVLAYVRCRKGTCGDDFGRAARQQEVINLLKPKVLDLGLLWHPARLKALVASLQSGIKTDMGIVQLLQLANSWREDSNNQPVSLVLSTSNGGYLMSDPAGSSDLLPIGGDFSAISARVNNIFQ